MNILLYDMSSYMQSDLIYYLEQMGFHCKNVLYKLDDVYQDVFFERKFEEQLNNGSFDFVMSTNFYPIVARICDQHHKKYISWVYDSPVDADHIEYYQFPGSYIFLFDREEAGRIRSLGGVNVFHLPLAVNPRRINRINITASDKKTYTSDISFIGQFYKNPLKQLMFAQSDYDKGYIDAIVETQLKIYGCHYVREMITDDLLSRLNARLRLQDGAEVLTAEGLLHSIDRQITHIERIVLLSMLGEYHNVNYYSTEELPELSHLNFMGTAYYFTEMPKIFKLSRLNLNPTLKSIHSGIPLRALDILGCGGVLLSNYQPELAEYFTDGEDVIMYESIEDAVCKASYYLKNDNKRVLLAQNGRKKVTEHFTYPDRINHMLRTAGII